MNYLLKETKPSTSSIAKSLDLVEFVVPKIKQQSSQILSSTSNPWRMYQKREMIETHRVDMHAIMQGMHQDGFIRQCVSKYVNSIFLRGYKIHSLKPSIKSYLAIRLQLLVDAMPDHNHIDDFFQAIAKDLVAYANVYIIKQRRKQPILPKGITIKGVPRIKPKGKLEDKPVLEVTDPIIAYELIHPSMVHIVRDEKGNVIRFEQWPFGAKVRPEDAKKRIEFKPEQIIHITVDKEDGFAYGSPFLASVIDDIRMLRSLEDHVSRLSFRFAFPFTQVKVGESKPGMQATEEDLLYYRNLIANAPADATITTNEKVSFEVVGSQGAALNLSPYLEHFKARSFSGLGMSSIAFGEGNTASRSTADAMTTEMHDQIKHFQNVFARNVNNEILRELLLEGGFDLYADIEKNWARIIFQEIEVEAQIKRETHFLSLLQSSAITFDEFRAATDRQPFTKSDWDDVYLSKILLPQDIAKITGTVDIDDHGKLMLAKHDADMQGAKDAHVHSGMDLKIKQRELDSLIPGDDITTKTDHAVTTGNGKRTVKKSITIKKPVTTHIPDLSPGPSSDPKTGSKGTSNKNQPSNQHGKRLGPKRATEELLESLSSKGIDLITRVSRYSTDLHQMYDQLRIEAIQQAQIYLSSKSTSDPKIAEMLFTLTKSRLRSMTRRYLWPVFHIGVEHLARDAKLDPITDLWINEQNALLEFNESSFNRLIGDICRPTLKLIKKATSDTNLTEQIRGVFESAEYRLDLIANSELPQAYHYGYASAAFLTNTELELMIEEDACNDCKEYIFTNSSSARKRLTQSPVVHPLCSCKLTMKTKSIQ